jgi:hypothetical protein
VKRLLSVAAIAAASLVQGCATSSTPSMSAPAEAGRPEPVLSANTFAQTNPVSAVAICAAPERCGSNGQELAHGNEIGVEKNAPPAEGHPLTAVVVTQCNLVVAVYMTMPDGRLLRFDSKADVAADKLVSLAYTASRSERVEVSCEGVGSVGYETHGPI